MSPSIPFAPSPATADAAILALADPSISFNHLATAFETSPEALALWMIRPDIRGRLETTDRVVTWRTRLVASNNLTAAIGALTTILEDFKASRATDRGSERSVQDTPSAASSPDHLRAQLLDLRRAENARRAASTLVRLANLQPSTYARVEAAAHQPARTRPAPTPIPEPAPIAAAAPTAPAPSFESLLAQLAPHLETIAADLGIDPNAPLDDPELQSEAQPLAQPRTHPAAPPTAPRRESRNDRASPSARTISHRNSPAPPTRPGDSRSNPAPFQQRSPALIAGSAAEHWP